MKKYIYKLLILTAALFLLSCEDYLDKAPEAILNVEDVFKNFDNAQGFVEEMYALVVNYGLGADWQTDYLYGDEAMLNNDWMAVPHIDRGNLQFWLTSSTYLRGEDNAYSEYPFDRPGVWDGSLKGIRKANIVIRNIDLMTNVTQEEKDVILGQAYFFRAFFHTEIFKFWGRFPYIKEVLVDEYRLLRPETYKECALEANEDFEKAAKLLPVDWDNMSYGQKTLGENMARVSKGAAYALQGKNLLYAASPLMRNSHDTYNYDKELCSKAVDAFAQLFKLVDQGRYKLASWEEYDEVFWKSASTHQWVGGTEFIFGAMGNVTWLTSELAKISMDLKVIGGSSNTLLSPTHNFIYHNFGMANGLSIEDDMSGAYGAQTYDPANPFDNRDPRFYKWITIDRDVLATSPDAGVHRTAKLFTGGEHRSTLSGSQTGYFYKKFFPTMYSKWNDNIWNYQPTIINMRLTDAYLMYAEALHAAKGSATEVPTSYILTAEQVVNMMRDRAGIPHVHPSIVSDNNKFMDELRRERSVEMSYEADRWNDIRRWAVADQLKYRMKTGLNFPEDHSYFEEFELVTRVCDYPKHFWLPFEMNQTQFYEGFPQNPGW